MYFQFTSLVQSPELTGSHEISGGGNEQQQQTEPPTQQQPQTQPHVNVNYDNLDYLGDGARGGALNNIYKAAVEGGAIEGIANIQEKNGVVGVYVMVSDANIGNITFWQ